MIKGVIFDLDGVLVHTDTFHYEAWKTIADQEGIYFDEEINNRLRGVSRMASFEIILEKAKRHYTAVEKDKLVAQKNDYYRKLLTALTPASLAPGTLSVLTQLSAQNIKLAIGSSSQNARFILEKLGISHFFSVISDGHGLLHPKPHPEVFLKAAAGLSLAPSSCLVVEDAKAGIDAAYAGGFKSVGIGDAALYEKCDYRIDKLEELLTIIKVSV